MFTLDTETNKITMEPGDTGGFKVEVNWVNFTGEMALVLGVCDSNGDDVLVKSWPIENGAAHVDFCNHDTRDIEPGNYKWQLRIVTNPEYDEDGNVIAKDCEDKVISVFDGDKKPPFRLAKKGARV